MQRIPRISHTLYSEELCCASAAGGSPRDKPSSPLWGILLPSVWDSRSLLLSIIFVEVEKNISGSGVAQVFPTHFQLYNEAA